MLYIDRFECWMKREHKPGSGCCPEPSRLLVLFFIVGPLVWEWFMPYLIVLRSLNWSFLQSPVLHKESFIHDLPGFSHGHNHSWVGGPMSTGPLHLCRLCGLKPFHHFTTPWCCWLGLFRHCGLKCSWQGYNLCVLLLSNSEPGGFKPAGIC